MFLLTNALCRSLSQDYDADNGKETAKTVETVYSTNSVYR